MTKIKTPTPGLIVSVIFTLLFFMPVLASPLKVMIDAGHGGSDQGAYHNHLMEKDITLAVSLKLDELLKNDSRFNVVMTRRGDEFIPLDERKIIAEKSHVDVFVSIHVNSSPSSSAGGTEIYFENQNPSDEESMFLANRENSSRINNNLVKDKTASETTSDVSNILNDMNRSTHMTMSSILAQKILENFQSRLTIKTRAIRQAPFRVLGVSMAATLIELGFLTNPTEAVKLKNPETQKKMAQAIYHGLIQYKEKLDKTAPQP